MCVTISSRLHAARPSVVSRSSLRMEPSGTLIGCSRLPTASAVVRRAKLGATTRRARRAPIAQAALTPSSLIKVTIPDAIDDSIFKTVTADICYPQDGTKPATPKGVIVFMHGFSQFPQSYDTTIQQFAQEGFFVIAPYGGRESAIGDAGIFSAKVQSSLKQVQATEAAATKAAGGGAAPFNPIKWLQGLFSGLKRATQLALQQDGLQCVAYVTTNPSVVTLIMPDGSSKPLSTFLPKAAKKIGLCGHSMGGGLCFSVAAETKNAVTCIGVMAPMSALEPGFAPLPIIEAGGLTNTANKLLSGGLDFLVPASTVATLAKGIEQSASAEGNSVVYEKLPWYFHTSFEDELTLGDAPLAVVVGAVLWGLTWVLGGELGDGTWVETALKVVAVVLYAAFGYLVIIRPRLDQKQARNEMTEFFKEQLLGGGARVAQPKAKVLTKSRA